MSVATRTKPAWKTSDYMRIIDARLDGNALVVLFSDHTWAEVNLDQFLTQHQGVRWDRMTFSHYTLIVPTDEGPVEIPWLTIRSLSDPDFGAYLDSIANEQAQQTGCKIREWRTERRMTIDELAKAAELDPPTLARIEHGEVETSYPTLRRILTPLGHTLKDLAPAVPTSQKIPSH